MRIITFHNPRRLVFGAGSLGQMAEDYLSLGLKRLFILTIPSILKQLDEVIGLLQSKGIIVKVSTYVKGEPTFSDFDELLAEAKDFGTDSIAGIGGGSVLDLAKLVAAQLYNTQSVESIVGNGLLKGRSTYLICLPTTSGTGSEVSPNAILLDQEDKAKKGIISPFLVPDAAYIDPVLTLGLPPSVTAFTGIDAFTHCIEAYTNRYAHPMVDVIALEGIKLIFENLKKAVDNGQDIEARTNLALGSLYGGMCLGPVNTAAVHALAYPLGSEFKVGHGLSNALMLPYVMDFNLPATIDKYIQIALIIGAKTGSSKFETAKNGIEAIRQIIRDCSVPSHLSIIGIPADAIEKLVVSAFEVQRLLKNNPREVSLDDIRMIYQNAY
ncbi:MAG TPA: iron-containing alcohol dehydrogenase [Bacteroidales bacterium]